MAKILFYFPKLEPEKQYHYMPISALAVSAELLAQGHEITIWDDRVDTISNKSLGQLVCGSDQVMITAYTGFQLAQAYKFILITKEILPDKKIILGGPHATALPDQTLASPYIDEVFCGYAEKGEYELPWYLVDINKYINPITERAIYISSYSCVGVCRFCATIPKRELVFIPLDKVERDIDNLMKLYPFKEIVFFDSTIFTKQDRALFLAKIMKKHNLSWICDSRADEVCRMDDNILDQIMNSGLRQITIGLEVGNERMADFIRKGKNHVEKFKKCAKILTKYDVTLVSGLIFGMPTETIDELKQTIEYVEEIKKINKNFRLSTTFWKPLPKTELTDYIEKHYGYIQPNSLEKYAELGEGNHFKYNEWMDNLWIENKEEYKEIYDNFIKINAKILI